MHWRIDELGHPVDSHWPAGSGRRGTPVHIGVDFAGPVRDQAVWEVFARTGVKLDDSTARYVGQRYAEWMARQGISDPHGEHPTLNRLLQKAGLTPPIGGPVSRSNLPAPRTLHPSESTVPDDAWFMILADPGILTRDRFGNPCLPDGAIPPRAIFTTEADARRVAAIVAHKIKGPVHVLAYVDSCEPPPEEAPPVNWRLRRRAALAGDVVDAQAATDPPSAAELRANVDERLTYDRSRGIAHLPGDMPDGRQTIEVVATTPSGNCLYRGEYIDLNPDAVYVDAGPGVGVAWEKVLAWRIDPEQEWPRSAQPAGEG